MRIRDWRPNIYKPNGFQLFQSFSQLDFNSKKLDFRSENVFYSSPMANSTLQHSSVLELEFSSEKGLEAKSLSNQWFTIIPVSQSVNHSVILAKQTLQFHLGKTESLDILEYSVFQSFQVDKTESLRRVPGVFECFLVAFRDKTVHISRVGGGQGKTLRPVYRKEILAVRKSF